MRPHGTDRSRLKTLAGLALLSCLLASALAGVLVDDGFVPHRGWLDLRHPRQYVVGQDDIGPSPLGYFQWSGRRPLQLRIGRLEPGDHLTLKLRTDTGVTRVGLSLDGNALGDLEVNDRWRETEVPVHLSGSVLTLRQSGGSPAPVHFSRVSYSNLRGALEGPAPIWLTERTVARVSAPVRGRVAALGLVAALALLLAAWRRRIRSALVLVSPGLVALLGLLGWWQAGGPRPHVSGAAFASLLLLSPLLATAATTVRRLWSLLRRSLARLTWHHGGVMRLLAAPLLRPATSSPTPRPRRVLLLHLAIAAFGLATVAVVVIQGFAGPLIGDGDLNQWTFQASYVQRNLSLWPIPRLDLVNDQLFYPYGGDNVYQPWALEMHVFTMLGVRAAPAVGWLQIYFLLSLAVTAVGAYLLLAGEIGPVRASAAALAVTFLNFYALGKYPGHLGIACVHWMCLNLLADAVMVRRVVQERPLGARFLALRALLLVLVLGQDLSYVAGIALTSFLVATVYLAVLVTARAGFAPAGVGAWLGRERAGIRESFRRHPYQASALAAATLAAAWLWVPLVLDIQRASALYDFSQMRSGSWWANPVRILAPVLPGVAGWLQRTLKDTPEGIFAASPGLGLVLPAAAGVIMARGRRWRELAPFVVLLVLLLSFQPDRIPLLKALPWFRFARVSGRLSAAYPTILVIFAMALPGDIARRSFSRLATAGLVVLLTAEAVTAYSACSRPKPPALDDPAFALFTNAVRRAPGEAVLDWPFCLVGGNGVGGSSTGGFYGRLAGISVLQAFHGKKIVGKYFGRLHPDQIQPYLEAGWGDMFMPDDRDSHRARRQDHDFSPQQWAFLERFVRTHDFCGIILYTDLLPRATVAGFHRRFGEPFVRYRGRPWGGMEFIPTRGAGSTTAVRSEQ